MAFRKIGTLKLKEDRKGRQYLIGGLTFQGKSFMIQIYQNEKRKSENDPDWLIYHMTIDGQAKYTGP